MREFKSVPTANYPLNLYKECECLQELENLIYALQTDGPVLVMGDFNAHIGHSYNDRVHGQTNIQGHLLIDLMNRTVPFHSVISPRAPRYLFQWKQKHNSGLLPH